jgi:hypothetical protein
MDRESQVQHAAAGRHLGKWETREEQKYLDGTNMQGPRLVVVLEYFTISTKF